jgi:hypothetical protein
MKIYIIAGNREQFQDYKKQKYNQALMNGDSGLGMEVQSYVYVSDVSTIRGVANPTGVFYGTWRNRSDILDIVMVLRLAQRNQNATLDKIWHEVLRKSTPEQVTNAGIARAASELANEIDRVVLEQMRASLPPPTLTRRRTNL